MFDRFRKASKQAPATPAGADAEAFGAFADIGRWAARRGFSFAVQGDGFGLEGPVAGRPCRIELGRSARQYIRGAELRGRVELGIHPDLLLMVINRPLKDTLEKQAYSAYTDTLQTSVDASMPEEMRLLAMFPELGWDSVPRAFWSRYAVVADERAGAQAWMDADLSHQLMSWPEPAPAADQPFLLLLQRGRVYLRMQDGPARPSMQHLIQVLTTASENALRAFPPKP